jgi:hypothetical protein
MQSKLDEGFSMGDYPGTITRTFDSMSESLDTFGLNVSTTMGDVSSGAIGKFSTLQEQIDANLLTFGSLQKNVDTWKPQDKHVNIYYHHIDVNSSSNSSGLFSRVKQNFSSITGGI